MAPEVRSTDMSRTVLTAHAVLTGLYDLERAPANLSIQVAPILGNDLIPPVKSCALLAEQMRAGREHHRKTDAASRYAHKTAAEAFGIAHDPATCTATAMHDDCIARRFAGHAPSQCIDGALCDMASREAAREIRAALASGGELTSRMAAGRLCRRVAEILHAELHESKQGTSERPL